MMILTSLADGLLSKLGDVVGDIFGFMLNLVPGPPPFFITVFGYINTIFDYIYIMDAWFPINTAFVCVGIITTVFMASTIIKIVRTIVSYLTFGGGST